MKRNHTPPPKHAPDRKAMDITEETAPAAVEEPRSDAHHGPLPEGNGASGKPPVFPRHN